MTDTAHTHEAGFQPDIADEAVVQALLLAEARRDIPAMTALLADDFVFEMPYADPPAELRGRQAMADTLTAFLAPGSGFYAEFTFHDIAVHPLKEPGRFFAEYRSVGTVAGSGHVYRQRYAAYLEVRDGLVTLWREYFNPLTLKQALDSGPS
ncbi:nuclear transport factor 2 family protein [Nonomuraea endophytica]|uniref:nuclear transport factor 2 family protein n=1 Tax=Nonomuraea endophytica TaxID=714136 RepID=UPI0037CA21EB